MTTIGFIGAGHIGSQIARKAVENGYDVVLSNSREPETLTDLVAELGPRARAATPPEAAQEGDIVVVTVPLKAYLDVPVEPLVGKTVIDTNNYYFERDGHYPQLDNGTATVSGMLQEHLVGASVVKSFNSIPFGDITADSHPAGDPRRRAQIVAGDDAEAKATVIALLDQFGFDALDIGGLDESWRAERDRPVYGKRGTVEQLRALVAEATR
jgi:predicted dinucleotide-binding enzyme